MPRLILRYVAVLWGLQVTLGMLAHILFDWRAVSLAVTGAYLALGAWAALALAAETAGRPHWQRAAAALSTAALWQLPMLLGSLNLWGEVRGWTPYNANSDLLDFAMESWGTVLMPALAQLPPGSHAVLGYAWYYVALAGAGPALALAFALVAAWPRFPAHRASPAQESQNPSGEGLDGAQRTAYYFTWR